jgi:Tissue inhibitor of metalloproteinase
MKVSSLIALLASILLFPNAAVACRCMQTTVESILTTTESVAFRGTVMRQVYTNDTSTQTNKFVFAVGRVFKGCDIQPSDRIVVQTGSNSAMCGLDLKVGTNYLLTSRSTTQPLDKAMLDVLGQSTKISRQLWVSTCDFVREFTAVTEDEKKALRNHNKQCNSNAKCVVGADCPKEHYCDAGKCIPYNAPCPFDTLPVACFADPCTVAKPCTESTCLANYCGGCNAIFVAPNGTRVCN